jgi:hypothetical protein
MGRRVFFSFHYEDVSSFRANVVRNSWLCNREGESSFIDASLWEAARKQGDAALKRLIDNGLHNTSVTAVLIGSQTFQRRWVRYEIAKSFARGNGIFAVHVNSIRDKDQSIQPLGPNPLDHLYFRAVPEKGLVYLWEPDGLGNWKPLNDLPNFSTSELRYSLSGEGKLSSIFRVYGWDSNSYAQFPNWAEMSAQQVGR